MVGEKDLSRKIMTLNAHKMAENQATKFMLLATLKKPKLMFASLSDI